MTLAVMNYETESGRKFVELHEWYLVYKARRTGKHMMNLLFPSYGRTGGSGELERLEAARESTKINKASFLLKALGGATKFE